MPTHDDTRNADLVGESSPMRALRREIERLAPLRSSVLLLGETGVGKGAVARALHRGSRDRSGAFVHLDCAALTPHLVESEIFGHERGAFTGAVDRRPGRFERAASGTIFLDEIGELSPRLQGKLLRVLEDREFERLGGNRTLAMTARVVAATARDLPGAVREGSFRADLYFRLNVIRLVIPPLRERLADLPALLAAAFERLGGELALEPPRLTEAGLSRLDNHPWPGNVRELFNVAERLMVRHADGSIGAAHVDAALEGDLAAVAEPEVAAHGGRGGVESIDRISAELRATGGNVAQAARRLGLPRSTLRHWIRRHEIR